MKWRHDSKHLSSSCHGASSTASTYRQEFQSTAHPQSSSKFCQLPVELRFRILRFLHRHPEPTIRPISNQNYPKYEGTRFVRPHEDFKFSSQLLATCQLLYHEGSRVLYHENVLSLETRAYNQPPGSSGDRAHVGSVLYVLDSRVHLPRSPFSYTTCRSQAMGARGDLLSLCRHDAGEEYPTFETTQSSEVSRVCAKWLMQIYPGLRRFQNFELRLSHPRCLSIGVACRALRGLLQDHNVFIRLQLGMAPPQKQKTDYLDLLKYLRCRSVKIAVYEASVLIQSVQDHAQCIEQIISGNKPALDLLPAFRESLHSFIKDLPVKDGQCFDDLDLRYL